MTNEAFSEQIRERMASQGTKGPPSESPRKADPGRMVLAETQRRVWRFTALCGTTTADLLSPNFWQGPAFRHVKSGDLVEVLEESGLFYSEFIVRSVAHDGMVLVPIKGVELKGPLGPNGLGLQNLVGAIVVHRGAHKLWSVEIPPDRVLKDGFAEEDSAKAWLGTYLKMMSR